MTRIRVNLKKNPYDILVGDGILSRIGGEVARLGIGRSAFIITSPRIGKLYLAPLAASLRKAGIGDQCVALVPDGERNKNTTQWRKVSEKLAAFDDSRRKKVFVVNLGGGVIGDLGGFVAATYHRGISYVQVPTTLLACVDSGVGGKVGVDLARFKNSIGAFWQPKLVFADLSVLSTLSGRMLRSGIAEVVKYAVAMDPALLAYFEKHCDAILALDPAKLHEVSKRCYELKVDVVERDERDTSGIRIVLNYGHTIGHAVESASKYGYTHGEAISIGMACANDIAVRLGILSSEVSQRVERLLARTGLPTRMKNCRVGDIFESMANDKKFVHGKNRFVLLRGIGKTVVRQAVPMAMIKSVIRGRQIPG